MADIESHKKHKRPRISDIKEWIVSEMKRNLQISRNVKELRKSYMEFRKELEPFYHAFFDKQSLILISEFKRMLRRKDAHKFRKLFDKKPVKQCRSLSLSEQRKTWIEKLRTGDVSLSASARHSMVLNEISGKRGHPMIYIASGGMSKKK